MSAHKGLAIIAGAGPGMHMPFFFRHTVLITPLQALVQL